MPTYNFKQIQPVPTASDFVDIILTRTQRGTPTVVHEGYKIQRIRNFYMRKVKFTQQNFNEKLTAIIEGFPRVDDIHPFYADLLNVLYDRDHYKLALAQINMARSLIDALSKDYNKLLKYADTLYRCKQLKRASLGRMCTLMRKQKASLAYLEEVRKHMARLPSIDPATRTLLVTGYPNVGKSSFMNKVTRAEVEVQPYAFTTKSLYVGHMDYKYLRWQVIDTPGILDHPLEERNTIEMQAVTALAHLQCSVLFFIDISEECGFSIEQQLSLFENVKPLFANKPLIMVANKVDVRKMTELSAAHQALINAAADGTNAVLLEMSNATEFGMAAVKERACDLLLEQRVSRKTAGKRVGDVLNRISVTQPVKRDDEERPAEIPASVTARADAIKAGGAGAARKTEKERMAELGLSAGTYMKDQRLEWDLAQEEWRYDVMPSFMDGKNVFDFVDPDIVEKLEALEREEEGRLEDEAEAAGDDSMGLGETEVTETEQMLVNAIRKKKHVVVANHRMEKDLLRPKMPRKAAVRTVEGFKEHLEGLGVDSGAVGERGRKRGRSLSRGRDTEPQYMERQRNGGGGAAAAVGGDDDVGMDPAEVAKKRAKSTRSSSRGVSERPHRATKKPSDEGLKDLAMRFQAKKKEKLALKKVNLYGKAGESDRKQFTKMPKWLYCGSGDVRKTRYHR